MHYFIIITCQLALLFLIRRFFNHLLNYGGNRMIHWITGVLWFVLCFYFSEVIKLPLVNMIVSMATLFLMIIPYKGSLLRKIMALLIVESLCTSSDFLSYVIISSFSTSLNLYDISYLGEILLIFVCERISRRNLEAIKHMELDKGTLAILSCIPISVITVICCQIPFGFSGIYSIIIGLGLMMIAIVSFYLCGVLSGRQIVTDENRNNIEQAITHTQESSFIDSQETITSSDKLLLSCVEGEIYLIPSQIIMIESNAHKSIITLEDQSYSASEGIGVLENKLSKYGFIRVHRCYLVNSNYIKSISNYSLTLDNGMQLPVSKSRYREIKDTWSRFTISS